VATVGGGQSGRDPPEAVGGAVANAGYAAGLLKNVDHLGAHAQVEVRQLPRRIGQKVEEIPLGDEGDVGVGNREVLEVGQADHSLVGHRSQLRDTLLGHLREPSAQTKLVEHVERGGMDRVAAEVAEEVIVLFEHEDLDAGAGEEESKHRARRSATDDAAGGRVVLCHMTSSSQSTVDGRATRSSLPASCTSFALSAGPAVVPAGSSSRTWLPGKVTTPERRI